MDDEVEWPSQPIPQPVKDIIARFYSLLDSPDPSSSYGLTTTVLTPDAIFIINKRELKGVKEIQDWKTATESILTRHHRVHRLYTCNDRGDDLLMTGTLTLESRTGLVAEAPYCARCVVDDGDSDAPRIKHWQGWLDNAPFTAIGLRREKPPSSGVLDTIGGR